MSTFIYVYTLYIACISLNVVLYSLQGIDKTIHFLSYFACRGVQNLTFFSQFAKNLIDCVECFFFNLVLPELVLNTGKLKLCNSSLGLEAFKYICF